MKTVITLKGEECHNIDEELSQELINLNADPFIKTSTSCCGHIPGRHGIISLDMSNPFSGFTMFARMIYLGYRIAVLHTPGTFYSKSICRCTKEDIKQYEKEGIFYHD
jgi:hypothetical protein